MSNLALIIGNKNYSSWSLRPWVFMKHHHIDFEERRIALYRETTVGQLSRYNSDFKVPILRDGELEIWDSLSILEYVSETCLDGNGWPRDVEARAIARSVSSEMHSSFVNVRTEMPMNCRRKIRRIELSPGAEREIKRIKALWRDCRTQFGDDGEWLFGNYSIADAMFAPVALRFEGYSIPLGGAEEAYVQSVLRQPCIIEWMAAAKANKEVVEKYEVGIQ